MAQWNLQTVENINDAGLRTNLLIDSYGNQHIIYEISSKVYHTYWDENSWETELVFPEGPVLRLSATIDFNDVIHVIVIYNSTFKYLIYYKLLPGQNWLAESLETGVGDSQPSIECFHDTETGQNIPHISYKDDTYLKHKYYNYQTSTWITETVDPVYGSGSDSDIKIDINGDIHIAYQTSGSDLKYAYYDGSDWSIIIVDGLYEDVGTQPSIVIDSDHQAHITYYDATNDQLKYAKISH
jgi:hypothetical protein